MVTKATKKKGSKVTVSKLTLTKDTVKNLTKVDAKKIRGGGLPPRCVTGMSMHGAASG